jgi:beta-N-acetylhexosaminidase
LTDVLRDAYAVLLPAFGGLELADNVLRYLDNGGVSVLLGESREEYVGRAMSAGRRASETAEAFISITRMARERAGSNVLVAIDQEFAGIPRLHDLVPALPSLAEALELSSDEIVHRSAVMGQAARLLGVNVFLAPIVDVVTGPNPWLHNRNLGRNPAEVSRLACSFVRGVQAAGIAATAKHFPGHPVTELDPALYEAVVKGTLEDLKPGLNVFRDVIESGVKAVMAGPALVPAVDAAQPSSTSRDTLALLRGELGFKGLIISDDIDAPGILRGRAIDATAVASLAAGADLLLLSSEAGLDHIAQAIVNAVQSGVIEHARLSEAASRVRALASELSAGSFAGGTSKQTKD